jgi:hypothetical protein
MALLPAVVAAAMTLADVGLGQRGAGLAIAAAAGVAVLLVIALPIDLLRRRGTHAFRAGRRPRDGATRRRS